MAKSNVEINVSNYCDLIDKKNFLNAFPFGWASECLLFDAKWTFIEAIWRKQVTIRWDDDNVGFAIDQHA